MTFFVAWMTASVVALLVALREGSRLGEWVFKPLASTAFVAFALWSGALSSSYGRAVLVALALSWGGDVLLIPKMKRAFLGGLGLFLLGHVAYGAAFVIRAVSPVAALLALALLAAPLRAVGAWLLPSVPRAMKLPVLAYMTVITAMVALAVGTVVRRRQGAALALGALGFYLSDLSVARERFVSPGFANKLWGLPLYFTSQMLLASTVADA